MLKSNFSNSFFSWWVTLALLLSGMLAPIFSQAQNYLPEILQPYHANEGYYWSIPTFAPEEERVSFRTTYSGYTGPRNVVYSSYNNFLYQTKGTLSGLEVRYTQMGSFISQTQVQGLFGVKIALGPKVKMAQSIQFGANNFSIGGGGAGGASVFKPDLSLGNAVKIGNSTIGIAYQHVLNPAFQPYVTAFYYKQRINVLLADERRFGLGRYKNYFTSVFNINIKRLSEENVVDVNINDEVLLGQRFRLGAMLYNVDMLGLGGGFTFPLGKVNTVWEGYFYANLKDIALNSNRYQIRLKFYLE